LQVPPLHFRKLQRAADLPNADAGLDAGSLLFAVIASRIRRFFASLSGRQ
jgi:hypothetical protein